MANLLPTYGHFTGEPHQGTPPTGKWLEYGMVNIVRFEDGKLAEAWFGMDPLVEMQQMGAVPSLPPRQLSAAEKANVELFQQTINTAGLEFDNLTAFGDVVVALRPPQYAEDATTRKVEIYHAAEGSKVYSTGLIPLGHCSGLSGIDRNRDGMVGLWLVVKGIKTYEPES